MKIFDNFEMTGEEVVVFCTMTLLKILRKPCFFGEGEGGVGMDYLQNANQTH
jgi:hypothetical protein